MTHCQICKSPEVVRGSEIQSPFVDQKYTLYRCCACRSFFFDSEQHPFDLREFYNHPRQTVLTDFVESDYWKSQVAIISRLLGKRGKRISVLDVGSRTGDFLLHWGPQHVRIGVELNRENAGLATSRGIPTHNDYIERINFDSMFDVISCYAVLEHISDPAPVLSKLVSLLDARGVLVIMIPTIECLLRKKLDRNSIYWHMYSPPGHVSFYSRNYLDSFMRSNGMTLARRTYSSGGLAGLYSRWSESYGLLKEASCRSLKIHFEEMAQPRSHVHRTVAKRLLRAIHLTLVAALDDHSPLKFFPWYDHMYSYYVKS